MDIEFNYPITKKRIVIDTIFGEVFWDPYRWLEKLDDEKVQSWIQKQNQLYNSVMGKLSGGENLYREFLSLYFPKRMGLPSRYHDRYFFSEQWGTMNYSIIYTSISPLDPTKKKEVLNPNKWGKGGIVSLDWMYPSPDGSIIAYGKSEKGSEESTLCLLNVGNRKHLPDMIQRTRAATVAWLPDNSGFYYTRYPKRGEVPLGDEYYNRRLYFHKIGQDPSRDSLVFGEDRKKEEWIDVSPGSDENYILVSSTFDWTKNDLYLKKATFGGKFKPIAEGLCGKFSADVLFDKVYLYTNLEAPKGKIMVTDVDKLDPSHWKELIPEGKGVIENFLIIGRKLVVRYLEDVHSRVGIYSLSGKHEYDLEFPTMGSARISGRWDSPELFCYFTSFFYPPTIFRYSLNTKKRETFFQMDIQRDFSSYELKQERYKSKDGKEIPIWLMFKKGTKLDGNNPTFLTGYGGFNVSMTPDFRRDAIFWLDKGGIYAIACLRGGGEFGEKWHRAGMLEKKQNVFDDFIAASEFLIDNNWTNPDKLAIKGRSNGGLLMGAVVTQRPELYKAVVCGVPLLDMIRYQKFKIARLWIHEYGSVESKEQFDYLKKYSPYQNVNPNKKYPAILFTAGRSDTRVHPMHAMKMAALMQDIVDKDTPILLYVEPEAGHGVGKPLKKALKDLSDEYLFLMWQVGMLKK